MRTPEEESQRIKPYRYSDAACVAMLAFAFTCIGVGIGLLLRGGFGL